MTHHVSDPRERYYRCYLMRNEHIVGYQEVFSHDDDAAIERAKEILKASTFVEIELWRGTERVASIAETAARG